MATCPHCGDYLSEGHRCLGKELRMARMAGIALSGALLGAVVVSLLVEHPPAVLLAATGRCGA
jgi:hypothetical protein